MSANMRIEEAIENLIKESAALFQTDQIENGWQRLADAHILSQPYPWLHTKVHWKMLRAGLHQSNQQEIFGQILRLLVAAPGSLLGRYPMGNTGRSNVSMFQPMTISKDLQKTIGSLK